MGGSMADIIDFKTRDTVSTEETVKILEEWIEEARRGEIVSVALVGLRPDGSSTEESSSTSHVHALIGAIRILETRVLAAAFEGTK